MRPSAVCTASSKPNFDYIPHLLKPSLPPTRMSSNDDDHAEILTITHINQFPNEILVHVFSKSDYEKDNCSALLSLACVCKHWRDILWSSPRFWTSQSCSIPVKLKNDGPNSSMLRKLSDHFERWYGRAGNVPRELTLSLEKACRKTPILYAYFAGGTRWKTLSFSFGAESNWPWLEGLISNSHKPYWPDLTTLEIIAPSSTLTSKCLELPLEYTAPNLTHLKILIFEIGFQTSITSIFGASPNPCANLTTFDFEGALSAGRHPESQSLSLCMHLLLTAPRLEVLRMLDGQGLSADVAMPEQYSRLVPLKHEALRELKLHWNKHTSTLLRNIALPRLEMLDLADHWVEYDAWTAGEEFRLPSLTNALEALVVNSTKAATSMGASFGLKRLILESILLGAEDRYGTVMVVREMVEELSLDCSPCAWHEPVEFFDRLDRWASSHIGNENEGAGEAKRTELAAEPFDLFPNISIFTAVTNRKSRVSFTVSREDQVTHTDFKASPLAWWGDCQMALDEAEARYPDSDSSGDSELGEWDDSDDGQDDEGGWEEEDDDEINEEEV